MKSRGFTLIELLVALFITAIVLTIGYGAINQALNDRSSIQSHEDRLTQVQTAVQVMVQDFAQLSARPVRDSLGVTWLPCILSQASADTSTADQDSGSAPAAGFTFGSFPGAAPAPTADQGEDGPDLVIFTRAGWANPAGIQRPTLERVSYRFFNGTLRRLHWTVLDGTETSLPVRRDLLKNVESVSFRFMNDSRQWINQWPPLGTTSVRTRPFAVEITLQLKDWGQIVRVIEVPA